MVKIVEMSDKTKDERVSEGMTILFKLRDVGVEATNPGFDVVKKAVRQWINDGHPVTLRGIQFGRLDRVGELVLPRRSGVQPGLSLKVIRD
jgi:hypothetical protein